MAKKLVSDLPEGMITEILVRLAVKTLLRCKSVCKPWLSLISNPHFIKSHLHHAIVTSLNNPTLFILQRPPPNQAELASAASIPAMFSNLVEFSSVAVALEQQKRRQLVDEALLDVIRQDLSGFPVHFDRLVMPRLFYPYHRVVSACNGIICLANMFGHVLYLWNPSIRQCKKLPAPVPHTTHSLPVDIGFGYDSVSDDYKVLRFVYEKMFDAVPIVQVYSTKANCWREFRAPILENWELYEHINVVVNGVLYFDARDKLISFDLNKEVFGLVPYPSFIIRKKSNVMNFKGSLAMVFKSGLGVDLWTLNDFSPDLSWTKRFSIVTDPDPEIEIWLSSYLGAGQFRGSKTLNSSIFLYKVLYDYEKKETKIYGLRGENADAALKYIGTLVSLDGFEPVE